MFLFPHHYTLLTRWLVEHLRKKSCITRHSPCYLFPLFFCFCVFFPPHCRRRGIPGTDQKWLDGWGGAGRGGGGARLYNLEGHFTFVTHTLSLAFTHTFDNKERTDGAFLSDSGCIVGGSLLLSLSTFFKRLYVCVSCGMGMGINKYKWEIR